MKAQDKKAAQAALLLIAGSVLETLRGYWNLGTALQAYSDMKQRAVADEIGCSQSTVARAFQIIGGFASYEAMVQAFHKSGKTSALGFIATIGGGKAAEKPSGPISEKVACRKVRNMKGYESLPATARAIIDAIANS